MSVPNPRDKIENIRRQNIINLCNGTEIFGKDIENLNKKDDNIIFNKNSMGIIASITMSFVIGILGYSYPTKYTTEMLSYTIENTFPANISSKLLNKNENQINYVFPELINSQLFDDEASKYLVSISINFINFVSRALIENLNETNINNNKLIVGPLDVIIYIRSYKELNESLNKLNVNINKHLMIFTEDHVNQFLSAQIDQALLL